MFLLQLPRGHGCSGPHFLNSTGSQWNSGMAQFWWLDVHWCIRWCACVRAHGSEAFIWCVQGSCMCTARAPIGAFFSGLT